MKRAPRSNQAGIASTFASVSFFALTEAILRVMVLGKPGDFFSGEFKGLELSLYSTETVDVILRTKPRASPV
jgi:hypothetical protein